jgi:peroxiredoxin
VSVIWRHSAVVGGLITVALATHAAEDPFKALTLSTPSPREAAREFTVPASDGNSLRLVQYRGQVVVLNFWATWCVPCREEMPAMERVYERFKDRGLVVLAVSVDVAGADVARFVEQRRFTFPIGLDPKRALATTYGVRALPSSFLIDRRGQLAARAIGPREWDSAAAHAVIEALLEER